MDNIQHDVVHTIYHGIKTEPTAETKPTPTSKGSNKAAVAAGKKVGRNEPCPCGSGKKYKKCCGN